jgi:hypothetical protein
MTVKEMVTKLCGKDEFFQSQEVVAGAMFGLQTEVPWEFNMKDGKLYRSIMPM